MRSGLRIVGNAAVGVGAGSVALVSTALPESGGAVDLIAVQQPDGTLRCSPWHVRFGKYQGLLRAREKLVTITVNDEPVPELAMRLGRSGVAYFVEHAPHDGAGAAEPKVPEADASKLADGDANGASDDSLAPDLPDDSDDPEDTSDEHEQQRYDAFDAASVGSELPVRSEARDDPEPGAASGDVEAISVAVARLGTRIDAFADRGCDSDVAVERLRHRAERLDALAAPSGSASDEGLEERRRPTGDASASRGRGAAATFCRRARRARWGASRAGTRSDVWRRSRRWTPTRARGGARDARAA